MRTAILVLCAFHLSCAGALWSDGKGSMLLPIALGNAEVINDSTCVSGGPISLGFVGVFGNAIRAALFALFGRDVPAGEAVAGARQSGCMEQAMDLDGLLEIDPDVLEAITIEAEPLELAPVEMDDDLPPEDPAATPK